jgi:signal transduction histidine kinase
MKPPGWADSGMTGPTLQAPADTSEMPSFKKRLPSYAALFAIVFVGCSLVIELLSVGLLGAKQTGLTVYLLGLVIAAVVLYARIKVRARPASIVTVVAAIGYVALALTCASTSLRWIGSTFPGFFLLPNRVIPAVGLPHWTGVQGEDVLHHTVIAVNGRAVASANDVYRAVGSEPPGSLIEYTLAAGGEVSQRVVPSMIFGVGDYGWIFALYLVNGLLFTAAGLVVFALKPRSDASWGMFGLGAAIGTFAITATDLYGPQWFFRLHLAAEAFLPATLIHLALVFPKNYIRRRRVLPLLLAYGTGLCLAAAHQAYHFDPATYSLIYNLCAWYLGIAAIGLITSIVYAYRRTASPLVRQRVQVFLIGTLAAAGPAALLLGASALSGGTVPVNAAALTTFFFPLTLAYSIIKHDLFAIDRMMKRAAYHLVLTGTVFLVYALVISVLDLTVHRTDFLGSVVYALTLSLAVVLLFDPVKARARRFVDRVCFRRQYDPTEVLETTSLALASTPHLQEVLDVLLGTACEELQLTHASVYLRDDGMLKRTRTKGVPPAPPPAEISPYDRTIEALGAHTRALSIYDLPREAASASDNLFRRLGADLLLPLRFQDHVVGIVCLGPRASGTFYAAEDVDFLATLATQSVVSVLHTIAYRRIEDLNRDLERKVEQRTAELATANGELRGSLDDREQAYVELQRRQEQLLQAEKMAALGRLTAGIAHEISTPLGAALSSLRVAEELVAEYRAAIDAPSTEPQDHHELATELAEVSAEARELTMKAAGYVRSIKLHGLGREDLREGEIRLTEVMEETSQLLAHRLRLCGCTLRIAVSSETPPIYGDASRLAQVVTNLVTNAVDAYRDTDAGRGEIRIEAGAESSGIVIRVSDDGAGIPPENLARIFEELFTTKPPGLGTGLGLSISKGIIADCFRGTLAVDSTVGRGSTFTIRLPTARARIEDAADREMAAH